MIAILKNRITILKTRSELVRKRNEIASYIVDNYDIEAMVQDSLEKGMDTLFINIRVDGQDGTKDMARLIRKALCKKIGNTHKVLWDGKIHDEMQCLRYRCRLTYTCKLRRF